MNPVLVILTVAVIGVLLWRVLGQIAPAGTVVEIRVRAGRPELTRGTLRRGMMTDIADILDEARVRTGALWIVRDRRVVFSRSIPGPFHQRLRNVLLNA